MVLDPAQAGGPARRQLEKSEEKLRDSEQHFRNLADSGMALTWTSGPDGRRDWFNQPWLAFTGRSAQQEAGDGWAAGLHPEDRVRCLQMYAAAFQQRERFSLIFRLRDREGQHRWVQEGVTPRLDSDGRFLGFIGHCLDISESKLAEERIQHLNRVLRTVRDVNELMVRERGRDSLIRQTCRVLVENRGYLFALIVLTDSERRPVLWATAGNAPFPPPWTPCCAVGNCRPLPAGGIREGARADRGPAAAVRRLQYRSGPPRPARCCAPAWSTRRPAWDTCWPPSSAPRPSTPRSWPCSAN